ncbi:MAG: PIN domain-containing protein [Dehalococcoidia bacterium]
MTIPLDTNIIIRHLAGDHPQHSPRARALFQDLYSGARAAMLTEAVLVETVQVLSSKSLYNLPRADIERHLGTIVRFRGVKLAQKRRYLRALELYAATPRLSFVDALLAVLAQENPPPTVLSFDQGFDGISGLTRVEP